MNKQKIAIKKLGALVLEAKGDEINQSAALSLNAELMNLGFIMSKALLEKVKSLPITTIKSIADDLIHELRQLKGGHVQHKPMYPNFPEQVMEASDLELYSNALVHYWTYGQWKPDYAKLPRTYVFESTKYKEIGLASEDSFKAVFTQLLMSNDSLSEEDKQIIEWFMLNYPESALAFPDDIPFMENKSVVAAILLACDKDITPLVKTTTDVLRIATYLSEGDLSLAENTKFVSLPRRLRKKLVKQLDHVITEEDIGRHKNKWKALLHNLHVGDYSDKAYKIASKLRNNEALDSFYARLEKFLANRDVVGTIELLKTRPGEFARKLDHLLRLTLPAKRAGSKEGRLARLMSQAGLVNREAVSQEAIEQQNRVAKEFLAVANKIPTRNLLQLLGHLNRRNIDANKRVVFPKGNTQRAVIVRKTLKALDASVVERLTSGIKSNLVERFSSLEPLGKVWIDPDLIGCPLPSQQRSASEGLLNVARGTRLPIMDAEGKNTLRFFIYWVGRDIDLSATFHLEDFSMLESVSYTNLRARGFQAYHSGDITLAPNGTSEFIDITIDGALKRGARYLAMNVLVYNGPTFAQHETCFAGWMTRSKPKSNEIFDEKTVQQKIDVRANSRNAIPVIFDLKERKAIWTDISTSSRTMYGGNNVESNRATIQDTLEAIVDAKHKVSLYEIFEMHVHARGELVDNRLEADTVFSLTEGVTPFDINQINTDFIR